MITEFFDVVKLREATFTTKEKRMGKKRKRKPKRNSSRIALPGRTSKNIGPVSILTFVGLWNHGCLKYYGFLKFLFVKKHRIPGIFKVFIAIHTH